MEFRVIRLSGSSSTQPGWVAYLAEDRWDDWSKYRTQFYLSVIDPAGNKHDIGSVKIGQAGLLPASVVASGYRAPEIPDRFSELGNSFFSLGQDETYYEALNSLPEGLGRDVMVALKDCAFDSEIFQRYVDEYVMGESLLRFIDASAVRGKLHRLANGDARLTPFNVMFKFNDQLLGSAGATVDFNVFPESQPPTNVHVLIGRNGSGKTRFLQAFAKELLGIFDVNQRVGVVIQPAESQDQFAGLVYISFSAFDDFELPRPSVSTLRAAQVSLTGEGSITDRSGQTTKRGARVFSKSFEACRSGLRRERWLKAIRALETDPLFAEAEVTLLADLADDVWRAESEKFFGLLSSGHAVVLLTITRMVELVDERTIVLMDEPEGHLHPPLLAALVRSVSDLLTNRNGLAVIATHSPVVLQEVPKACVWMLRRFGATVVAERPQFETFGENVGALTREVFGLEVTSSGFHKMVADAVHGSEGSYESVIQSFSGQLGSEARSIALGLAAKLRKDLEQGL